MLLINNHYAISTPVNRQTAAVNLAARAEGYGFPGFVVDGNDLLAVYETTADAVKRALAGEGATLIECRTYRMGFHNTSDNPKEYRDQAELDDAEQRDPIERVRRFATREGIWSADEEAAALDEIRSEIETAQRQVEELSKPGAAAIFEHVYETLPPRLQQQRTEAMDDASFS
jgi:pyruvate dehydrogenase E1 component alpha subunit